MRRTAALAITLLAVAKPVVAQEPERVVLADAACDDVLYSAEVLRRFLALELRDAGAVLVADSAEGGRVVLTLSSSDCSATRGALLIMLARETHEHARAVALDGADGEARARLAAMAVAELLLATRPPPAASGSEPAEGVERRSVDGDRAPDPASETASAGAPPEAASRLEPPDAPDREPPRGSEAEALPSDGDRWRIRPEVCAGVLVLPSTSTGLAQARLGARVSNDAAPVTVSLAARGGSGMGSWNLGDARLHLLALDVALLLIARESPVAAGAGVEVSVGVAWSGATDEGGVAREWTDPFVTLSARGELVGTIASGVAATLGARAGWTALGVELRASSGAVIGGLTGGFLGIDIGLLFDAY